MGSKENCVVKNKNYKLVAPDGGWGYMICVASVVIFVVTSAFVPCFGMMYKELIDTLPLGSTEISLFNSLNILSFAIFGFLTSPLLNYFSKRKLAFISMAVYNTSILRIFVTSQIQFYIIGILQGCSFGTLFNITNAVLNEYFVEKRLFANSTVQTITGLAAMFAPQFVKVVLESYGFIGLMLITTGISLQGFFAVALMQPVEWHMKKIPIQQVENETHLLITEDDNVPTIKLNELESEEQIDKEMPTDDKYTSNDIKKSSWVKNLFNDVFELALMKSMLKTNVTWAISIATFGDMAFIIYLPLMLYSRGWIEDAVAWALTLVAFGDLAGRVFFLVFSKWIKIESQVIYLFGMLITVLSRIGFLFSTSEITVLSFLTLVGISRSIIVLFIGILISETAGSTEKFPSAMGFLMIVMGILHFIAGIVIGAIRDYTNSYTVIVWILNGLTVLCMISWTMELVHKRWHRTKKSTLKS